jgi:predicted nucleotide-binding protein
VASKIHRGLLERLTQKLGLSQSALYARIQKVATANHLPRHLGALLLAGQNGIGVHRYSTPEDLAELRGLSVRMRASGVPVAAAATPRRNGRSPAKRAVKTKENTVFVVHGRDSALRDATYEFLGALGLRSLEWGHAIRAARGRGGNPYVNDAVTRVLEQAQAIVVLLSPDDEVKLKGQFVNNHERSTEGKLRGQARPNVLFETGIAIGTHHRKTVIVQVGDVKPFSDIGGMHILRLSNGSQARNAFANRLEDLGCNVDRSGDQWLRAGDFRPTGPISKTRR